MRDSGFGCWDSGVGIWDAGLGIRDSDSVVGFGVDPGRTVNGFDSAMKRDTPGSGTFGI